MINCAICGHEMEPNGALLFSPPICETPMPSSAVTKFHICRECYVEHLEPVLNQGFAPAARKALLGEETP